MTAPEARLTRRGLLGVFAATAVVAAPTYANAFGFLRGAGDIRRIMLTVTIQAGTSLVFAAIGEIFTERAGILNLGLEGVMIMGAVRRSHDCGRSGWFLLIPFYNLWLFFEPGQAGDNRYGPDPRKTVVTQP
jgi:uncharacterized membrane protein YhaH (DUF805 family)